VSDTGRARRGHGVLRHAERQPQPDPLLSVPRAARRLSRRPPPATVAGRRARVRATRAPTRRRRSDGLPAAQRRHGPQRPTSSATLLPGGGVNAASAPAILRRAQPPRGPESARVLVRPDGTCGRRHHAHAAAAGRRNRPRHGELHGAASAARPSERLRRLRTPRPSRSRAAAGATSGPAAPTRPPSAVWITGTVAKVTVTLTGLNHTFPTTWTCCSWARRTEDAAHVRRGQQLRHGQRQVTFDEPAAAPIPGLDGDSPRAPTAGQLRHRRHLSRAPAPRAGYPDPQQLSVFNGANPNGTWSLYVNDDLGGDAGSISGGWSLEITTSDPLCCLEACEPRLSGADHRGQRRDECKRGG